MNIFMMLLLMFVIIILFSAISFFLNVIPIGLWISAAAAGINIKLSSLIGMRLRRTNVSIIIKAMIKGTKANLSLSINQLESHYLSGGHVDNVINALIAAHRANLDLSFERAAAIDLAGRDVFEAVRMSVTPKIIETPWISAVAINGIEVKVIARVTVRANIARLVGGAGEETIIARVGEGIVTTVGSSQNHKEVLENPDRISQTVLTKGLDSGTAFEILSIDIADIDVGRNIGANLQIQQAEADKQIAQAKAEERRALAIAQEQEMKAKVEQMRAHVIESQAQVPLAIAEAFRSGNISVSEYYNLENKLADTKMREAISTIKDLDLKNIVPKNNNNNDNNKKNNNKDDK
jgi:uncharacterized protein YqfA (UPF0365 family)